MVLSRRLGVPSNPRLPHFLQTKTGFTEVNELDLSNNYAIPAGLISALASLPGLRSLNLTRNKFEGLNWTTLGATLTGLTYLNMALTDVGDGQLASLTPFLSSLTDLNLHQCTKVSLDPDHPTYLASLKALTRLDLSKTNVCDEGMRALAPLTALNHLNLNNTAVGIPELNLLAPLATRLACLLLGASYCRIISYQYRDQYLRCRNGGGLLLYYADASRNALRRRLRRR
jgi:hypothetical protein